MQMDTSLTHPLTPLTVKYQVVVLTPPTLMMTLRLVSYKYIIFFVFYLFIIIEYKLKYICTGQTFIKYITVTGMAHAWSGGSASGTYPFFIIDFYYHFHFC